MTYDDVIARYGSLTATARALDLAITTVHSWRTHGVPRAWQAALSGRYAPPCRCQLPPLERGSCVAPEAQETTPADA